MKFQPLPYQQYCIDRLIEEPELGLFLDMGLGKTVITLTAVNELRRNRWAIGKTLVIAPKKVAERTWDKEAAKWDHLRHLRVQKVLGSKAQRINALCTPADVYVINRENVQWLVDYYRNAWPFDLVVIDELSSFKSRQAKRWKSLTWVRPHIKRIVGLTGTPASNGLMDLWAQVYLLDEGQRLGKTLGGYRARYFDPGRRNGYQVFSYNAKPGAEERIREAISDICISMSADDYLQLPDLVVDEIPVVLDARARAAYDKMERDMLLQVDESTIDAATAAVLSNKLLQLCNGAVYDDSRRVANIHDCKLEAFLELLEGLQGKSALVFYQYKHDLSRIQEALAGKKLRVRPYLGDTDADAWNNHEVDVLLAHPASTAYGLNLQDGGNHVVWFGPTWSLEQYQQANARLHRMGQTQKVIVHHLIVQGGRDEDVMDALREKDTTQERLLNGLKARIERVKSECKTI